MKGYLYKLDIFKCERLIEFILDKFKESKRNPSVQDYACKYDFLATFLVTDAMRHETAQVSATNYLCLQNRLSASKAFAGNHPW